VDYLDLYMLHWPLVDAPSGGGVVDGMPLIHETWAGMQGLVHRRMVRHLGVCNMTVSKLERVFQVADCYKPAVLQVEGHPYLRQEPLLEYARSKGMAVVAFSPLGSGDRSKSEFKKEEEPKLLEDPTVLDVAKSVGRTPAQVLIRWAIQRGTATIPKSSNPERIQQNMRVFGWELPEEAMRRLGGLRQFRYVCGGPWCGPDKQFKRPAELWEDATGLE